MKPDCAVSGALANFLGLNELLSGSILNGLTKGLNRALLSGNALQDLAALASTSSFFTA